MKEEHPEKPYLIPKTEQHCIKISLQRLRKKKKLKLKYL